MGVGWGGGWGPDGSVQEDPSGSGGRGRAGYWFWFRLAEAAPVWFVLIGVPDRPQATPLRRPLPSRALRPALCAPTLTLRHVLTRQSPACPPRLPALPACMRRLHVEAPGEVHASALVPPPCLPALTHLHIQPGWAKPLHGLLPLLRRAPCLRALALPVPEPGQPGLGAVLGLVPGLTSLVLLPSASEPSAAQGGPQAALEAVARLPALTHLHCGVGFLLDGVRYLGRLPAGLRERVAACAAGVAGVEVDGAVALPTPVLHM